MIQPCDQSIIVTLKRFYRRNVLRRLLLNDTISYEDFVKSIDVLQVMKDLETAWETVKESTIRNGWSKLAGISYAPDTEFIDFRELVDQIPQLVHIDDDMLQKWIDSDQHDKGFALYEDQHIVKAVNAEKDPIDLLESSENSDQDDDDEYLTDMSIDCELPGVELTRPGQETVLESLQSCLSWANESNNERVKEKLQAAIDEIENM